MTSAARWAAGTVPAVAADPGGARERILAVALRRFAREGYGRTRLRDVAAEAGLSTGPMYHHFGSKPALYRAVGLHALEHMTQLHDTLAQPGADRSRRERVRASLARLADALHHREEYIWLGVQMEHDAVGHAPVAELRADWADDLERVFRLAAGTEPDLDEDGLERDPTVVLMLALSYGQARAVVRNGPDVLPPAARGLDRLLADPPSAP
jgi:AcrR family transcriptional regulator